MKISKKALSVFMAVLMVMTSLSVGLTALAADPYDALAAALKADGVRHASWGSPQNYITVVNDPTGEIEAAAEAFWVVAAAEAPNHTSKNDNAANTAHGVAEAVLTKLQNEYGVVGDELANARTAIKAFVGGMNGNNADWKNFSQPDQPQERTYGIRIVRDIADLLLAQDGDISKLPDSIPTAVEYLWAHGRHEWRSGFANATRNACNYLKPNGWSRTETAPNTEIPAQLKAFGSYFTEELLKSDLDAMTSEELVALVNANQAAVDACSLWGNDAVMNHFFDKAAIKAFISDATTARDKKFALEFAQQIAEKMKNDPAAMEYDALVALLDEMNALRANLNGCTAEAIAYALGETGLKMEQINAFIDSVEVEKQVIELQGIKATIDALIAATDLATISDEDLTKTWAEATAQYNMVTARKPAAVSRVFTEGTAYVTEFIHNAKVEIEARKLSTEVEEYLVYFNDDLLNTDLTTLTTDELINDRQANAKTKLAELAQYDADTLNRVFGEEKWAAIESYAARIDTTLTDRVEAQLDKAIDNYSDFGQITLLNYKAVKEAIGGVEANILEHITVSAELQAKYDRLAPMLEEYNRFVETKGMSGWQKYEPEYPTRDILPGDIARTEGEEYDVTKEKLSETITKIDSLMQNQEVTGLLGIEGTLQEAIQGALETGLYTDAMVNTIVTAIYPMLVNALKDLELTEILGIKLTGQLILDRFSDLNLNVYPNTLSKVLDSSRYGSVIAALNAAGNDWSQFNVNGDVSWGVHDKETFVAALGQALGGLAPILRSVLTNQAMSEHTTIIVDAYLRMDAVNLYNNAVLPLLEMLECDNIVPTATYNTYTTTEQLMSAILLPLLSWVEDTVAVEPVSTVLELLPKFAYIMEFGIIGEILKATKLNPILDIGDSFFGNWVSYYKTSLLSLAGLNADNLYDLVMSLPTLIPDLGINLSDAMFTDLNVLLSTVLGLVAPEANLVLPTINQAMLASQGTLVEAPSGRTGGTRRQLVVDKEATLLAVLRYILPMLGDQDFMDSLFALIGSMTGSEIELGDDIMGILKNLGNNPDNVIAAVTELFVPQEYASKQMSYAFSDAADEAIANGEAGAVINNVTYSEDWTKEQAQYISDRLPDFIDNMMLILGGKDTLKLSELIKSYITGIYTNETLTSLVLMVKDLLGGLGVDLKPILGIVGIDLSSWDEVTEGYNWGFEDGDKDGFAAALTKALTPFTPILATVLADQDLEVLGVVKANGYPGYKTGVIPILESLGCNPDDIMSYDDYAAAVKEDSSIALSAILTPVLNLLEEIYTDPVNKVFEILPNILYFINNGGLQVCVENTAQAIFVLLDTVRPIYDLEFSLNLDLTQIIIDALAGLEINGEPVNLKIPFLYDFNMLTVGTVTPYTSKSGEKAYRLENIDQADFVTVILRNVVELAFYEDNINIVADLIANKMGMSEDLKKGLRDVLNTFAKMYKEDNGVDKILGAAYTIFKGTDGAAAGAIGSLKDFNERWNAVFQKLYDSGNQDLIDLAKWADSVLDFLSFGFITGDGVGTNGLIDFFERLIAFFQGKVTDVSIDRTSANMLQGEQLALNLSFKPVTVKNKNAAWASSNERVATVVNGVVTAVGPGDAEITATTEDGGFTVSCVVRVRADKTALNEAIALVKGTELTAEQQAQISEVLAEAEMIAASELANQTSVDAACEALTAAFRALDLGTAVTSVAITQNGAAVGEVVYQKVSWTKRWNSTPVTLGVAINDGATVKSITWQYANWSVDDPEADIEPAADGMTAVIRAKNSVVGAHSCWIQVTVEDIYGNTVTSDPVKVRFYNYDWQK